MYLLSLDSPHCDIESHSPSYQRSFYQCKLKTNITLIRPTGARIHPTIPAGVQVPAYVQ